MSPHSRSSFVSSSTAAVTRSWSWSLSVNSCRTMDIPKHKHTLWAQAEHLMFLQFTAVGPYWPPWFARLERAAFSDVHHGKCLEAALMVYIHNFTWFVVDLWYCHVQGGIEYHENDDMAISINDSVACTCIAENINRRSTRFVHFHERPHATITKVLSRCYYTCANICLWN